MISVIMASNLEDYPGAASNREWKFTRAVNSFLNQNLGELIVISDGCDRTSEICRSINHPTVKLLEIAKQPLFSGEVRQHGIQSAEFPWICYLDTDDEFLPGHLRAIVDEISDDVDWMYFDDIVNELRRQVEILYCQIGTSSIAHKKNLPVSWPNGYGHDWEFIQKLGPNYKKIWGAGYKVNHMPGVFDI
jgi:glycosyltransferase involved in cell wall biosynthesis